jgi:hypothetical protein
VLNRELLLLLRISISCRERAELEMHGKEEHVEEYRVKEESSVSLNM